MTTAEKIINNCKKGLFTVVKNKYNEYCVFTPIKDVVGNYRMGYWGDGIDMVKQYAGGDCGYFKDEMEENAKKYNWQIVEVYRLPVESFKIGDKVRILDSIKETEDWEHLQMYYPDMIGEIKYIDNNKKGLRYGVKDEDGKIWKISHQYLAPYYDDEQDDDLIEIDGKKFSKSTIKEALKSYLS